MLFVYKDLHGYNDRVEIDVKKILVTLSNNIKKFNTIHEYT